MRSDTKLIRQAQLLGVAAAVLVVGGIILGWSKKMGEANVPALSTAHFSVAVLAGPKQAKQTAPANVQATAEAVVVAKQPTPEPVVEAERSSSLPKAVAATPDAAPSPEVPAPAEVIPPARVAMPGGHLATDDAPVGDTPNPFAVAPNQVYMRFLVDASGHVVRGGIVRPGRDPMRDSLIYKAMVSRTYSTKDLMKVEGGQPLWQMDLVIEYSSNEFLP